MRILTRTQYDAICDIVIGQKKIIEKKEAEIKRLKEQVNRLSYLLDAELKADDDYMVCKKNLGSIYGSTTGQNIDYPNSHVHSENNSLNDKLF